MHKTQTQGWKMWSGPSTEESCVLWCVLSRVSSSRLVTCLLSVCEKRCGGVWVLSPCLCLPSLETTGATCEHHVASGWGGLSGLHFTVLGARGIARVRAHSEESPTTLLSWPCILFPLHLSALPPGFINSAVTSSLGFRKGCCSSRSGLG